MILPDACISAIAPAARYGAPFPGIGAGERGRWHDLLEQVIGTLERLPAMTEEKFLLAGARLREISTGLKTITDNAAEAGRIMAGDEVRAVIGELETLFREMEEYFLDANRTAEQAGHSLGGILHELGQMHRLMVGFKDQVGNLRMLKMLTNIQSAALAGRNGGFSNVAADIGRLSQKVQSSSATILARIKRLHDDLERAVGMLSAFAGRQKHLGGMVVSAMRSDIAALAAMHANCSGGAGDVSRESAAIVREINNLVVSLQFQDITRQQMEHVRESLAGVRDRLNGPGPEANPGEVVTTCALQSAQLSYSAGELGTAVRGITGSLRSISGRAGAFAASIHGLFVLADEVGESSIGDMDQGLASIADSFGENLATNRNLTATMLSVTEAMSEITAFAEDIDYIGSEIRLIALNAIIKAVQAGRDGAAFSVIAETVKRQSVEVCAQAAAVVAIINVISRHIEALHLTIGGRGENEAAAVDGPCVHQERIAETFGTLKQFSEGVRLLLAQTDQASIAVMRCIDLTLAALDTREIGILLEQRVIAELDRLVHSMRIAYPAAGCDAAPVLLEVHADRYTMGSERRIHQQFAAVLSGRGQIDAGRENAPSGCGDFGENVELF